MADSRSCGAVFLLKVIMDYLAEINSSPFESNNRIGQTQKSRKRLQKIKREIQDIKKFLSWHRRATGSAFEIPGEEHLSDLFAKGSKNASFEKHRVSYTAFDLPFLYMNLLFYLFHD